MLLPFYLNGRSLNWFLFYTRGLLSWKKLHFMNRLRQDRRLQNCFFFFFSSMSLRNTYLFLHVYLLMQYLIKKEDKFGCKSIHIWENMPPAHFYNNISHYIRLWKEGCFSLYEMIPYLRTINRNTCILTASFCFSLIIVFL